MNTTTTNDQLPRALRNASVLAFWIAAPTDFRATVCRDYARHLGIPYDEIDPDMMSPEEIDFIWGKYSLVIDAWVRQHV